MPAKKSWVYGLKFIDTLLNEDSKEFKQELDRRELEKKTLSFKFNRHLFKSFLPDQFEHYKKTCYSIIDERVYNEVKGQLHDEGLSDSLDDICSILKVGYYKIALEVINSGKMQAKKEFGKNLKEVIEILGKDINQIQLLTNNKREEYSIKNQDLIDFILTCFKVKIKKDSAAATLIADVDQKSDYFNELTESIFSDLVFSLTLYINTNTDYKFKGNTDDILQKRKFTNKLLELVSELIEIIPLTDEKNPSKSNNTYPKDYIRNKIKRYIDKHPQVLTLFSENRNPNSEDFYGITENTIGALFYDGDYWEKVIDINQKIKRL